MIPAHQFFALRGEAYVIPRIHHDQLMVAYATFIQARSIVELGTGPGYATRAFLNVVRETDGHLWSVDIGETAGRNGLRDDPRVTFVTSNSTEATDVVQTGVAARQLGGVDLVYCDSDHSKGHVLMELEVWSRVFQPRVMFVDDTLDPNGPYGSPLEAVIEFCENHPWRWWNIPVHTGLAILIPRK